MCNQCEDVRRIHGNKEVWILSLDGGSRMMFTSLLQAEKARDLLAKTRPNVIFEITQHNNRDLKWE